MATKNPKSGQKSASAVRVLALLAVLRQANSARCSDDLKLQRCREDSDGVLGLDCYGRILVISREYFCTWKPGRGPSRKTYTLLIHQRSTQNTKTCDSLSNITGNWTKIKVSYKLMSVELFEHDTSGVCTRAVFQGLPEDLVRCNPLESVSFRRAAGRMAVSVSWRGAEANHIRGFEVRYRASPGNWSQVSSDNATRVTVGAVNASLAYSLQLRCQKGGWCTQCLWGREYHVLPELTAAPDFGDLEDEDVAETPGHRRLSLTWKFNSKNTHDGYQVSIGKASGEAPREAFRTTEPRITFILSYSSYRLEVRAFNRDSTSPALLRTIARRENQLGSGAEWPNVTVISNRSFLISWRPGPYVCYSAEWTRRGQEAAFKSFCSGDNHKILTLKTTQEDLEPYRKYTLTLHGWTDSDSRKRVNNSERTYGSTHFYFLEGAPVGAPANVSSGDEKPDSAVLRWSSIPEEEARGFLLGYVIYYTEYQKGAEKNVTVNPDVNSHTLEGLKSRTLYEVQISGFTRAGEGVRSDVTALTTDHHDNSFVSVYLKYAAILTTLLLFLPPILTRAKRCLWPSIPNPKKSNVMQKMKRANELEPLQSISTLRVEEWDTDNLHIVQKEQAASAAAAACVSTEMPPLLEGSEDEFGDVRETRPDAAAPLATVHHTPYTTVEMFRQAVAASSQEREPDATVPRPQLDYVRQFSADSTRDNQAPQ